MNGPLFTAEIRGKDILCEVTSDRDLHDPVFCFSLMAPPAVTSGGTMLRSDGSYGEVQLPTLAAGTPHTFTLRYANPHYAPVNRAWLPLGAYLRCKDAIIDFPHQRAGVTPVAPPPPPTINDLGLIPKPKSWQPTKGKLNFGSFSAASNLLDAADALAQRCNLPPLISAGGVPLDMAHNDGLDEDTYRIEIATDGLRVDYGGPQGAHYAGITLLVLREIHGGRIPCGLIEDAPRFAWRGQHLDCARHFYRTGSITRLIDLMALLKMNRFHWHFSDDEAFRLELESVPDLARATGMRGEGELVPGVFGGGPRSGGTYSADDVATVIDHARHLFVEVMPEIEFPCSDRVRESLSIYSAKDNRTAQCGGP